MKVEDRNAIVNSLFFNLSKADSFQKIQEILDTDLSKLDIHVCYVVLYKNSKEPLNQSLFFHAYEMNGLEKLPSVGNYYETDDLLMQLVSLHAPPFSMIIEPLFHHNRQLGFVIFDIGPPEHAFYELFPSLLSSAIWNAELQNKGILEIDRLDEKKQILESINQKVDTLNEQLDSISKNWKTNRGSLIITHKLASIGCFASGIIDEFEKNIVSIDNEIEKIQKLVEQYSSYINDVPQDKKSFETLVLHVQEHTSSTRNLLETAGIFARSVIEQADDYREDARVQFNIADIIDSVLTYLTPCCTAKKVDIKVNYEDKHIIADGSGVNMSTIITNLLINAINAVDGQQNAFIDINLKKSCQNIVIVIRDNGRGIEPELLPKIFLPTLTKKETADDTGMGLCIVKDIVTGEYGGIINVNSTPKSGSTFTITIPVK